MSSHGKQKVLIVLLFAAAAGLSYWQFFVATTVGRTTAPASDIGIIKVLPGEELFIRKLGADDRLASNGRNLFSFVPVIVAAPAPKNTRQSELPELPTKIVVERVPEIVIPPTPPVPAAPQPIPLLYTGYARDSADRMIAFIETTGSNIPAGHYNLAESQFLLGRYRVNRITADSVVVEDIDRAENAADRTRTIAISPSIAVRK